MSSADANKFIQKVNIVKVDASGNIIEGSNIPLGDYDKSAAYDFFFDTDYMLLGVGGRMEVPVNNAWIFVGETDLTKSFYPHTITLTFRHELNAIYPRFEVTGFQRQKDGIFFKLFSGTEFTELFSGKLKAEDFILIGNDWTAVKQVFLPLLIPLANADDIVLKLEVRETYFSVAASVEVGVDGFII